MVVLFVLLIGQNVCVLQSYDRMVLAVFGRQRINERVKAYKLNKLFKCGPIRVGACACACAWLVRVLWSSTLNRLLSFSGGEGALLMYVPFLLTRPTLGVSMFHLLGRWKLSVKL